MKNIVIGHKTERDELLATQYIQREGLPEAVKSIKNNLIKVIVGPRRAGKSVFAMKMLQGQDFAYLNFDDERLLAYPITTISLRLSGRSTGRQKLCSLMRYRTSTGGNFS